MRSAYLWSLALHALAAVAVWDLPVNVPGQTAPVFHVVVLPAAAPAPSPAPLPVASPALPAPLPDASPEPEPEPEPPPPEAPAREALPEPIPAPAPTPEPAPVPKPRAKPRPEPVPRPTPRPSPPAPVERAPVTATLPAPPAAVADAVPEGMPTPETASHRAARLDAEMRYMARLLAAIQARRSYPRAARLRRHEGVVRVGFVMRADGVPTRVEVLQGSGWPELDAAARDAVATIAPLPIPAEIGRTEWRFEVPVRFELRTR